MFAFATKNKNWGTGVTQVVLTKSGTYSFLIILFSEGKEVRGKKRKHEEEEEGE